jgi:DNA polymerase elongation subunit (family B)
MTRPPLAFDIETVGEDWECFDQPTRDYLVQRATRRMGKEQTKGSAEAVAREALGLSAGTGRIIVIAMVNLASDQAAVLYEGQGGWLPSRNGETRIYRGDERGMLVEFWQLLENYGRAITYNGRGFDVPYVYLRSALHGLLPSRQLLGNRYSVNQHCDLAEVLTFFGAAQERFSLDFWCRKFGIDSPKEAGIDGSQVGDYYRDGRLDEIAEYCLRDARATGELFRRLEPTLIELFAGR